MKQKEHIDHYFHKKIGLILNFYQHNVFLCYLFVYFFLFTHESLHSFICSMITFSTTSFTIQMVPIILIVRLGMTFEMCTLSSSNFLLTSTFSSITMTTPIRVLIRKVVLLVKKTNIFTNVINSSPKRFLMFY